MTAYFGEDSDEVEPAPRLPAGEGRELLPHRPLACRPTVSRIPAVLLTQPARTGGSLARPPARPTRIGGLRSALREQ
jgi:hypothetical protein